MVNEINNTYVAVMPVMSLHSMNPNAVSLCILSGEMCLKKGGEGIQCRSKSAQTLQG